MKMAAAKETYSNYFSTVLEPLVPSVHTHGSNECAGARFTIGYGFTNPRVHLPRSANQIDDPTEYDNDAVKSLTVRTPTQTQASWKSVADRFDVPYQLAPSFPLASFGGSP